MKSVNVTSGLQLKARDALWFLECHPASGEDVFNLISFSIQKVCKRGYDEIAKRGVQIRQSSKFAKRYKDELKKEVDEFIKEHPKAFECEKHFISIDVPYKELFGEEWKFDRTEYWGNVSFKVFMGSLKEKNAWMKQENWTSFEGFPAYTRTFEEMIIEFAKQFKKNLGDFCSEDFLTKTEKENHKKERVFVFAGERSMKSNKKYIHVDRAELNRRWLKWFLKTEYCKKNWNDTFEKLGK
jgi:hypothetical protein